MVKCLECQKDFEEELLLHRHLKSHKIHVADYYQKHFPRHDLHTGELIKFKSKDFYFSHEFNSRLSFKKWYKEQNENVLKGYCLTFLERRIKSKKLLYAPSQVELRSLYCPSMIGFNKLFGDYYKVCYDLGLRVKYDRVDLVVSEPARPENATILIDSREQTPLSFNCQTKISTLKFGDYGFISDSELNLVFERKSLNDFISSFGKNFERLRSEVERAQKTGTRIVVIVETDYKFAFSFDKSHEGKFVTATPDFVFHNVRQMINDFPNVQFLFAKNRSEASRLIQKIFYSKGDLFKYDLQFLYDTDSL